MHDPSLSPPPGAPPAPFVLSLSVPAVRSLCTMIRAEAKAVVGMIGTDAPAAAIDARARALDELTRAVLAGVVDRLPPEG